MTAPTIPATKVDATRTVLHEACRLALRDCGWPQERAHRWPPGQAVTPCVFIDVATMHQAPTERASAVALTFPVVLAVNGGDRQQVQQIDGLQAHLWQRLSRAATQYQPVVQSAAPEMVDVGGTVVRGIVFRVQTTVQTNTLCQQTLTQEQTGGTT